MSLPKTNSKGAVCCTRSQATRLSDLGMAGCLISLVLMALIFPLHAMGAGLQEDMVSGVPEGGDQFSYDNQTLRVNVWHDKENDEVYRGGEAVRVHFETNEDAYVVVYRIDVQGRVTILWPRSRYDDGFVFGYHHYTVPAAGAPQLAISGEEGVEYVEVIASKYPFDLRILEVDFHHETVESEFAFYVAGDPFLAMNEVNYAVTGLEDPSDYVVTNYTSYYVHQQVEHPRYLCNQCHDVAEYQPYQDTCNLTIHYDFGWYNGWYARFGYYPAYYYPAYYYVDPWSYRPWVFYWYTPWYTWPAYPVHNWSNNYYNWRYTPLARGDALGRYQDGDRRYRPLAADYRTKGDVRERYKQRENPMTRSGEPTSQMTDAMQRRRPLARESVTTTSSTGRNRALDRNQTNTGYRNTAAVERQRVAFRDTRSVRSAPGLRIQNRRVENVSSRPEVRNRLARGEDGSNQARDRKFTSREQNGNRESSVRDRQVQDRDQRLERRDTQQSPGRNRGTIRSVEPRKGGSRIWTGGRSTQPKDRAARPQQVKPGERGSSSSSSSGRSARVQPTRRSESGASKSPSSRSSVKPSTPRRSGGSKAPASRPRSSSRSSSGGRSGSRSGGRR